MNENTLSYVLFLVKKEMDSKSFTEIAKLILLLGEADGLIKAQDKLNSLGKIYSNVLHSEEASRIYLQSSGERYNRLCQKIRIVRNRYSGILQSQEALYQEQVEVRKLIQGLTKDRNK